MPEDDKVFEYTVCFSTGFGLMSLLEFFNEVFSYVLIHDTGSSSRPVYEDVASF